MLKKILGTIVGAAIIGLLIFVLIKQSQYMDKHFLNIVDDHSVEADN